MNSSASDEVFSALRGPMQKCECFVQNQGINYVYSFGQGDSEVILYIQSGAKLFVLVKCTTPMIFHIIVYRYIKFPRRGRL